MRLQSVKKTIYLSYLLTLSTYANHDNAFDSMQMADVAPIVVKVDIDAAAKRLSNAIKIPTISHQDRNDFDKKAFKDYHKLLEDSYPTIHKTMSKEILGDPRKFSLLYTWEGKDPSLAPIVLMAHQDVVPVVPGTEKQWEHGAYSGDISGGYIWGRGSLDDKLMIHAMMEAIEMKIKDGFQPTRTVMLVLGQDEEVGGPEGVEHIVNVLSERGLKEIAFILDEAAPLAPGLFPGIPNNTALIGTAEKGYLSLELKIDAEGGHSAMPPNNSNIGILAKAITKLEDNPFPYKITQTVRDQYRFMGPELPKEKRAMYAAVAFGDDDKVTKLEKKFIEEMKKNPITHAMVHTTTAVTMINSGVKENVLPPSATAVVNFRLLQGDTIDSATKYVRKVINDERVQIKDISASINPSNISDSRGSEYKLIEKTIRQTFGNDLIVSPFIVVGGADAKHFAATPMAQKVYRFTAVQVESAADQKRWHGVNERVLVKEFGRSIAFFHTLLDNLELL